MASEIARKLADNMTDKEPIERSLSTDTYIKDPYIDENKVFMQSSSSSYTLANDCSQISRNIDQWIGSSTDTAGVHSHRCSRGPVPVVQRSVLATSSSLDRSGMWYLLAMVLPICSLNSYPQFTSARYFGTLISTAEFCITQISRACGRAHAHLQQLAQDQVARELFATAMDIVLVIYAIGFMILSMYQASIFG